jgi:hypothetical protein
MSASELAIKAVEILRNPCGKVMHVGTQVMGARFKDRHVSELVIQMAGDISCQKLSSLNWFHFENLGCLLIIFRSNHMLMKA